MTLHQVNEATVGLHLPATATADICDANLDAKVLQSQFVSYGGIDDCTGRVETISTRYDNTLVKKVLREPGEGRVLLVDNQGSITCAMLGGNLARLAADNGWAGIVINGAVRDVLELKEAPLAVFALAPCPRRSTNRGAGERNGPVRVGGERICAGDLLVADADGIIVLSGPKASIEVR